MSARDDEAKLLRSLLRAAREFKPALDRDEADVFRFAAQLLKTRFPREAAVLADSATSFFAEKGGAPRTFPQVVADRLIVDIPRFRHRLEEVFGGVETWSLTLRCGFEDRAGGIVVEIDEKVK